ncbi:MAG: hypothetical protein FJ390_01230 [Verrucomicrobia bacterium]|nr:hypothetical protein [Verrucomicrobiota bacterium]
MLSSEASHCWKWRLFFIGVTLLVAGFIFFKNKKPAAVAEPRFQIRAAVISQNEKPFYQEETIDSKETYRMAHVASMTELPDGTLVTTWYAGSGELQPDVKIYGSIQRRKEVSPIIHDEGSELVGTNPFSWSAPFVVMTREEAAKELGCYVKGLGNALVFSGEDGVLHLLYVTVSVGKWSGSQLNLASSRDQGKTWLKSRRLLLSPFFNLSELVKNAPTLLVGGGWMVPVYQEFLGKFPELLWLWPDGKDSFTVTKSRIAGGCSFFQPSVTALDEKRAVAFCRDYQASGKIWRSETDDAGKSWSTPQPIDLPNHDSGIASIRLANGDLLLAFNDTTTSARNNLRLAISHDAGKTWHRIATIADDPHGDFSYPYFFMTRDGNIHLLYSWQRKHIHHVMWNQAWIDAAAAEAIKKDRPSSFSLVSQ